MNADEQKRSIEAAKSAGLAWWIEHGDIKIGPVVGPEEFGPHTYMQGTGILGACRYGCGCNMGQSSSSGPFDPFGACPRNPKTVAATAA